MIPMLPLVFMLAAAILFAVDAFQSADRRLLSIALMFMALALVLGIV